MPSACVPIHQIILHSLSWASWSQREIKSWVTPSKGCNSLTSQTSPTRLQGSSLPLWDPKSDQCTPCLAKEQSVTQSASSFLWFHRLFRCSQEPFPLHSRTWERFFLGVFLLCLGAAATCHPSVLTNYPNLTHHLPPPTLPCQQQVHPITDILQQFQTQLREITKSWIFKKLICELSTNKLSI